ncbi:MAG TPA: MFS transporter [Candidatus Dormibacteraeota bacterium]|nr:MFS transporter [Candidatus Dormibacteraeota bacterium]
MSVTETPGGALSARPLTYAAYTSFVPIGIATVLLGPMLPTLSERWSLNYAQAGSLITTQYVASTCAVAVSGFVVSRWGYRFAIKLGLVVMAAGLALLLTGPKVIGMLCIAAYGTGIGLAVPAANLVVAESNPTRRSATLNLLNFFWSMGAVTCPFLVAAATKTGHVVLFLMCVAGFSVAVAIGIALTPTTVESAAATNAGPILPLVRSKMLLLLILAALFFLYVGVENGFGAWIASYSTSLGTLTLAVAVATPAFFYAALTLGRWLAPMLLRLASEIQLVQAGLLLACAGMGGLVFSRGLAGVVASACAAGFGLSYVYPITISLLSKEFASPRIGSFMFVLSNIGGGLFPWIVGVSSTRFGTLKVGLIVPFLGCAAMFAIYLGKWTRATGEQPS